LAAGWKGYRTNLDADPGLVIEAYHRLWQIEKSFRMSKGDLAARPVHVYVEPSIQAHLNIVFAALAVSHKIETATGWSIRRFVRTFRRYRTVTIRVAGHEVTAQHPPPDDARQALESLTAH
jgi:transposase